VISLAVILVKNIEETLIAVAFVLLLEVFSFEKFILYIF